MIRTNGIEIGWGKWCTQTYIHKCLLLWRCSKTHSRSVTLSRSIIRNICTHTNTPSCQLAYTNIQVSLVYTQVHNLDKYHLVEPAYDIFQDPESANWTKPLKNYLLYYSIVVSIIMFHIDSLMFQLWERYKFYYIQAIIYNRVFWLRTPKSEVGKALFRLKNILIFASFFNFKAV